MERKEFLSSMGLTILAVCAGCSKSSSSPQGPSGVNFTIDLKSQLLSPGDSTFKSGVIVVRLAPGNDSANFTALSQACTHEGVSVGYNSSNNLLICPLHGSEFNTNGSVVVGPAGSPLKKYNVSISGDVMTVTG